MAKTKISEFSATPGNNTDIDGINIAEGCAPSGINDAIRELMAQLKDFQAGTAGDSFNGPVGTTTAAAGAFTTLTTSGAVTHNGGTANGVAYLNSSKVLTTGSALTFDGTNTFTVATSVPTIAINGTAASGTGARGIDFQYNGASYGDIRLNVNSGELEIVSGQTGQSGYFQTFKINGSEQMRLTSTGLGIGTSSPGSKLEVYRTSTDRTTLTRIATINNVSTNNPYTGFGTGLLFKGTDYSNTAQNFGAVDAVIDSFNSTSPPDTSFGAALTFSTGTNGSLTERMRLTSPGNLGLGVTPSAWGSGFKAFELIGGSIFSGAATNLGLMQNAYYDGTNYLYKTTSTAARYFQVSGQHIWYTAPSGTAGNAISFTQALTLDANRNLLLNGTSAGASAVGTLAIFNGTAPTGSVTDGIILYAQDVSSSSELKVRDEAGNVTTLSPHNFSLIPEGPSEDMAWAYYSEKGGKRINVDMLKLARMVEKLTGEKLVYES